MGDCEAHRDRSVLVAVVAAVGFGGLILAIAGLQRTSDRAQHAEAVIVTADALERLVLDLQRGQSGFVITRSEEFSRPALRALAKIPAEEERLRTIVAGEPLQEARAVRLQRSSTPTCACTRCR